MLRISQKSLASSLIELQTYSGYRDRPFQTWGEVRSIATYDETKLRLYRDRDRALLHNTLDGWYHITRSKLSNRSIVREDQGLQWLPATTATRRNTTDDIRLQFADKSFINVTPEQYVHLGRLWALSRRAHMQRWIMEHLETYIQQYWTDSYTEAMRYINSHSISSAQRDIIDGQLQQQINLLQESVEPAKNLVQFARIHQEIALDMIKEIMPHLSDNRIQDSYLRWPGIIYDSDQYPLKGYTPFCSSSNLPLGYTNPIQCQRLTTLLHRLIPSRLKT